MTPRTTRYFVAQSTLCSWVPCLRLVSMLPTCRSKTWLRSVAMAPNAVNSGAFGSFVSLCGTVFFLRGCLTHLRQPRRVVVLLARPVPGGLRSLSHVAVFHRRFATDRQDRRDDGIVRPDASPHGQHATIVPRSRSTGPPCSRSGPGLLQRPRIRYAINAQSNSRRASPGEALRILCC